MSTLAFKFQEPLAHEIWFTKDKLFIQLNDGRELGIPIDFFPKLRDASTEKRKNWRLIGNGIGIHWDSIDEDISVSALFYGME